MTTPFFFFEREGRGGWPKKAVDWVIYKKKQCYEVKVLELEFDYTLKEKDAIKKAINNYALSFEEVLKQHPKQWFNFYNFWSEEWD